MLGQEMQFGGAPLQVNVCAEESDCVACRNMMYARASRLSMPCMCKVEAKAGTDTRADSTTALHRREVPGLARLCQDQVPPVAVGRR